MWIYNPFGMDHVDFEKLSAADRVGYRIQKIRKERDLSRAELGQKVGLSADRIQQYENGARKPKDELLKKIAAALGVETAALADPVVTSNIGAMYAFFEMEERYGLELRKEAGGQISLFFPFSENGMNTCLKEWYTRREEYLSDLEKASSKEEKEALTREYHFWEWNYPTVLAKENSRKLRESYLKKKLQEIEDELKKLED